MPSTIPFIPDDAPFTQEQRAWLNGFLAGIFSSAPVPDAAARVVSPKIAVLYASQSGTAEGLARKLTKELKAKGYAASLTSLEAYTPAALATERYAVFLASTYGEGDAPDAVQPFYEQLCVEHFPRYADLSYSVFALGDRHYEHFCKFGMDLDTKLASLGATRICDRIECDVDTDEPFAQWKKVLLARLDSLVAGDTICKQAAPEAAIAAAAVLPASATPAAAGPTRDHPFLAPLVEKRSLTRNVSSKLTLHLSLSTMGSAIQYEAGDACGIVPQNSPELVEDILKALRLSGRERVQVPKTGSMTLYEALCHHLVVTKLSRKLVESYATAGQCHSLLALLVPEQQAHLDKYVYERGLIDLLEEYPSVLHDPAELVALLPKLNPRLYSISSSPLAHSGEVHTTVAVVRYRSLNRERGGVCSTLVADRLPVGDYLPIYIQPNKKFRLPKETTAPMIMIGPGTGIAPFRAFLHERRALGCTGRNWLFFGERSASTDFLYRDELLEMQADGHLTRLDLAFSRDQEHKIYVQDRMLEQAPELWRWIEDGASIYVCGDASRMAKDVDATLHRVVEQQGGFSHEAAHDYVQQLKDQHRYHRDVY